VKRVLVIVAAVAAALALASVAAAGDSVVTGHNPAPPAAGTLGKQAASPAKSTVQSGTLPFTGLDLAGIAVGASLLVGAGVIISRRSARGPQ
jgi:hypothetical protein